MRDLNRYVWLQIISKKRVASFLYPVDITDTPFDTIVSRGVSLFIRKKRSDYKHFVVTALHFIYCVAQIKWFYRVRWVSPHKI